jgi:hypothetical protein
MFMGVNYGAQNIRRVDPLSILMTLQAMSIWEPIPHHHQTSSWYASSLCSGALVNIKIGEPFQPPQSVFQSRAQIPSIW